MAHNYDSEPYISYEDVVATIRNYPSSMLAGLFFEVTRLSIEKGVFREPGGIERSVERMKSNIAQEQAMLKSAIDIAKAAEDSTKITSEDLAFTINCTAFQPTSKRAAVQTEPTEK